MRTSVKSEGLSEMLDLWTAFCIDLSVSFRPVYCVLQWAVSCRFECCVIYWYICLLQACIVRSAVSCVLQAWMLRYILRYMSPVGLYPAFCIELSVSCRPVYCGLQWAVFCKLECCVIYWDICLLQACVLRSVLSYPVSLGLYIVFCLQLYRIYKHPPPSNLAESQLLDANWFLSPSNKHTVLASLLSALLSALLPPFVKFIKTFSMADS